MLLHFGFQQQEWNKKEQLLITYYIERSINVLSLPQHLFFLDLSAINISVWLMPVKYRSIWMLQYQTVAKTDLLYKSNDTETEEDLEKFGMNV